MPPKTKRKLRLQDYLPYRLSVAANSVSQLIASTYREQFKLTIPQWRLIAVLADEGPLTQQELTLRTVMDKVAVTRAARELLRRNLLRCLPNAADGRSHHLELTRAGEDLYEKIAPLALAYEAKLLAGVDPRDIARLHGLLRQLQDAATSCLDSGEPFR